MRIRSARRRRGFTLIEMIVATVLLALGVVAALGCIASATRATSVAGEYTTAALLAQQRFAELQVQPDEVASGQQQGEFGELYPGYTWSQSSEPTGIEGVYRVSLVVEWQTGQALRSARFATCMRVQTEAPQ